MPLHVLDDRLWFPPVNESLDDGLLAIGGDLSEQRLLLAYKKGIFPWFDGDVPLWWCPDPRFVLLPQEINISQSMHSLIKKKRFHFTRNKAFNEVIHQCKTTIRTNQQGTWITDEVEIAFRNLHKKGIAQSAEAWENNELVGGLYGILMDKIFFGESMFSKVSNASKFAFISLVQELQAEGIVLIDCQVYTEHLASLGAKMIPRTTFLELLEKNIKT